MSDANVMPTRDTDRYRVIDVIPVFLDDGHVALYRRDTARFDVVDAQDAARLLTFQDLRLLDDSMRGRVGELLESEADIRRRCAQASPAEPLAPVETVGVPTRNRADLLCRTLESYWRNHQQAGRAPAYMILDSSEPHVAAQTRARVAALSRGYAGEVSYTDSDDRVRLAHQLARESGVPLDVVSFGLLGFPSASDTTGGARNFMLLRTMGQRILQIDDDTVCEMSRSLEYEEGLVLGDPQAPEMFFAEDAFRALRVEASDFLGTHEALLGHPVAALAQAALADDRLDVSRANRRFLRRLCEHPVHVALTMSGAYGDSGFQTSLGYVLLEGESWERFVCSPQVYARALESRRLLRQARRATVTDRLWCQSITLGLDNARFLPPFVPVWRGYDSVLGEMVVSLLSDACLGLLPWIVAHRPEPARTESEEERWGGAGLIRFSETIVLFMRRFWRQTPACGTDARVEGLGRYLTALGALSDAAFEEALRVLSQERHHRRLSFIQSRLDGPGAKPRYWVDDLTRYAAILRDRMDTPAAWLPADVCEDVGVDRALSSARAAVQRYGQLLLAWQPLCRAARALELPS